MSERTTLIKKAVLTSVGATSNLEMIKNTINDAMQDVVKVANDLVDELEKQGKVKEENARSFIKGLKDEASKKSCEVEKRVSDKVAKNVGLVTRQEFESFVTRLDAIEEKLGIDRPADNECQEAVVEEAEPKKKGGRGRKSSAKSEAGN